MLVDVISELCVIIVRCHTGKTVHKIVNDALVALDLHIDNGGVFLGRDVKLLGSVLYFHSCFVGEKIVELLRLLEIKALKIIHAHYHAGDDLIYSLNTLGNGHCAYLLCGVDDGAEDLLIIFA